MARTKSLETIVAESVARFRRDIDKAVVNAFKEGLENGKIKTRRRARRKAASKPTGK